MRSQDRLHGEVSLVPPVSWQILGIFLFVSVAVAGLFLSLASYAKSTVVRGEIQGDRGIVRALPQRTGTIEQLLVEEGQHVRRGQPLARVSVTESEGGASLAERRLAALDRRTAALQGQAPEMAADTRARLEALQAQISGGEAELASLSDQIVQQEGMVRGAEDDLARIQDIAKRGFISGHDVRLREDKAAERHQELSRLRQDQATRRSQIASARAEMAKTRSEYAIQMRTLEGNKAEVEQAVADSANARSVVVTAGADGVVTGITAHRGEPVQQGQPIMTIIPDGTRLQAVLQVPTTAAGFIEKGQNMRIAVDAYPYETYGTIPARVDTVSSAAVPLAATGGGDRADAFMVRSDLASPRITAYGAPRDLRPGMTVSARITTRRRSLLGLLFDPLYAVARR
jgi:membrane fusion protein